MISNQVVLHHTVHVQKGMYHAPPYTDPFMAACPAVGCIILNGHVGVSGCLATAAVSESNESTEERTCKNGGMNLPNIRVWVSVSCAARHVEIAPSTCCRCGFV